MSTARLKTLKTGEKPIFSVLDCSVIYVGFFVYSYLISQFWLECFARLHKFAISIRENQERVNKFLNKLEQGKSKYILSWSSMFDRYINVNKINSIDHKTRCKMKLSSKQFIISVNIQAACVVVDHFYTDRDQNNIRAHADTYECMRVTYE